METSDNGDPSPPCLPNQDGVRGQRIFNIDDICPLECSFDRAKIRARDAEVLCMDICVEDRNTQLWKRVLH